MWEIVGDHYRHVKYPQWEIHKGTSSRFELRNTITDAQSPLFEDNRNANLHTVMDVADEAIRAQEFLKSIGG